MIRPRVVLADDHQVVRSGLKLLLSRHGLNVVGEASQGEEAVALTRRLNPDLLLLDLTMPPGIDGLQVLDRLRPRDTRVLVLTMHDDPRLTEAALRLGAVGCVLKQAPGEELIARICELFPEMSAEPGPLTDRECDVLRLFAQGYGNKEVSQLLDISVKTVETHRSHLFLKLGLSCRADLVQYALRHGFLSSGSFSD